jgi:transaldolase
VMCRLGVAYISPFIGRWEDVDVEGIDLLYEIRSMVDRYHFSTEILAASLRSVRDIHESICAGADIATVSVKVLEKAFSHSLTNEGMEKFLRDWRTLGIHTFP